MIVWRQWKPGQQLWCWPSLPEIFWYQHVGGLQNDKKKSLQEVSWWQLYVCNCQNMARVAEGRKEVCRPGSWVAGAMGPTVVGSNPISWRHVLPVPRTTAGIIQGMGSANERRSYNVTSSLIGRAQTQNDPWIHDHKPGFYFCFTQGQFWPSGIVVACVCPSIRPSPSLSAR